MNSFLAPALLIRPLLTSLLSNHTSLLSSQRHFFPYSFIPIPCSLVIPGSRRDIEMVA